MYLIIIFLCCDVLNNFISLCYLNMLKYSGHLDQVLKKI